MARIVPSTPEGAENNGHAWRAARILEIGRRMGGPRAMYEEVIEQIPGLGLLVPHLESHFMCPGDPNDMKEHLIVLRVFDFFIRPRLDSLHSQFSTRTWKSVTEAGVVELFLDIVGHEGFLKEHVRVAKEVLFDLMTIIARANQHKDKTVIDAILSRTRSVWKAFWESRHLMHPYSRTENATGVDRDRPEKYKDFITAVLSVWNNVYLNRHSKSAPADIYVPHVSLALWMRNQHPDLVQSATLALKGLDGLDKRSYEGFAREAIIEGVGLEAYLKRLDLDISRLRRPEQMRIEDYTTWRRWTWIMTASSVLPHLIAHGTLDSLIDLYVELAKNSERIEESDCVWYCVSRVFSKAFEAHWITRIERRDALPLVALRGEDLITIFSKGLHQVARPGCQDRTELIARLCEDLIRAENVFQQLRSTKSTRFKPEARAFYDKCLNIAPEHWYAALSAVDTAGYRQVISKDHCETLIGWWETFGVSLGLHRDKERKRLEQLKRLYCGWHRCEHHSVKPEGSLRKCAGCNDVRYCTRECQVADWKDGQHQNVCGKRLKAS
ncbi:unnamed protein product [Peniophora sp. CBMAI 1063]|nr:unnamed protein product [Peniophora sp. CBMAI 1063]